jgi:NDP-sugar pyrophosphorylase family protein
MKSVGLGAIVVIAAQESIFSQSLGQSPANVSAEAPEAALVEEPLACVEILGRTITERMIERLVRTGVESVFVILEQEAACHLTSLRTAFANVKVEVAYDAIAAISEKLGEYSQSGIDYCFVVSASTYVENDLLDLFYFHRESRQAVTRAVDPEGPLSLWVVDCAKAQRCPVERLLSQEKGHATSYFVRGYVNRLRHPRNLRRFAVDSLCGRCEARPSGKEIKPGVWVDEGADIHRRARLVAPAYIGRGVNVREGTLITRCSAVEAGSRVDSGSVIDDTSVFANTEVGICLDVCHAVVSGNRLLSLERNCMLEIHDASLLRSTVLDRVSPSGLRDRGLKPETEIATVVKKSDTEKGIQLQPHGSWVPILSRECE